MFLESLEKICDGLTMSGQTDGIALDLGHHEYGMLLREVIESKSYEILGRDGENMSDTIFLKIKGVIVRFNHKENVLGLSPNDFSKKEASIGGWV